jgi:hypothetical protein
MRSVVYFLHHDPSTGIIEYITKTYLMQARLSKNHYGLLVREIGNHGSGVEKEGHEYTRIEGSVQNRGWGGERFRCKVDVFGRLRGRGKGKGEVGGIAQGC